MAKSRTRIFIHARLLSTFSDHRAITSGNAVRRVAPAAIGESPLDSINNNLWPSGTKTQYRSASVLQNRRVVFNIKGNDYRLIVAIAYKLGIVYVKFIGTHAGGTTRSTPKP